MLALLLARMIAGMKGVCATLHHERRCASHPCQRFVIVNYIVVLIIMHIVTMESFTLVDVPMSPVSMSDTSPPDNQTTDAGYCPAGGERAYPSCELGGGGVFV